MKPLACEELESHLHSEVCYFIDKKNNPLVKLSKSERALSFYKKILRICAYKI